MQHLRGTRTATILGTVIAAVLVAACDEPSERRAQPPAPPEVRPLPTAPTPPDVERACRRAATVAARCPAVLPEPRGTLEIEGNGDFEPGEDRWLLGLQMRFDAGAFHVLIGGRSRPFPLDDLRGAWPVTDEDVSLSLVGAGPLEVGDPAGTLGPPIRPWVWARTTVAGAPALMLGWGPFPASGTIHGGHQGLVWNAGGSGYVVTAHFLEGTPPDRRLATLRAVALSFRPPP